MNTKPTANGAQAPKPARIKPPKIDNSKSSKILPESPEERAALDRMVAQASTKGPYFQAVRLQRLIFRTAHRKDTTPLALSSLARSWSELEERKRILKMRFKPGDVRPSDLDPRRLAELAKRMPRQKLIDLPAAASAFTDADPDDVEANEASQPAEPPAIGQAKAIEARTDSGK